MKKIIYFIILSIIFIFYINNANTQTPLGSWLLPTHNKNVSLLKFYPTGINMETIYDEDMGFQYKNSAGGYNFNNGDLLFYILNNKLYNQNTEEIGQYGTWNESGMSAEVQIINRPGNNNRYYVFYSYINPGDESDQGLFYYNEIVVDPNTGNINFEDAILFSNTEYRTGFALTEEIEGERYIYLSSDHVGIDRYTVTNTGLSDFEDIIGHLDPVLYGKFDAHNFKLKINDDNETILAWINIFTEELYVVNVEEDEIFVYNIDRGRMGGIEFSPVEDNVIYISCSDEQNGGIIRYDYENGNMLEQLTFNGDYGRTFLQQAPDGNIYAVSNGGDYLGRIDMPTGDFSADVLWINFLYTYLTYDDKKFYILPENSRMNLVLDTEFGFVSCPGDCDGWATAQATGGTPPYTYEWFDSEENLIGTGDEIYGLCEGEYTVCVTDNGYSNVCTIVQISFDPNIWDYSEKIYFPSTSPLPSPWDNETLSFAKGLEIESGETLELTNNTILMFGKNSKLIIRPGATLIVNNSILTNHNACPVMWGGVVVRGNKYKSQYIDPSDGIQWQGKIVLENNAIIENAFYGCDCYMYGSTGYEGGIVHATDAIFRNNTISVAFEDYHNFKPGYPSWQKDNISYFKNCIFETNINFLPNEDFSRNIQMSDVEGIKIKGCDFIIQPNAGQTGLAIATGNASFYVDAICTSNDIPCSDYDGCTFSGFYGAIGSMNFEPSTKTININRAEFYNNQQCIGVYNNHNFSILNSTL